MIRRQARLRREYLYRKGVEERQKAIQDKKDRLKRALEGKRRYIWKRQSLKTCIKYYNITYEIEY